MRPAAEKERLRILAGRPGAHPKVFNGHDKLFFFVNWEQFRQTTITNNISTVPDAPIFGNFTQARLEGKDAGTDAIGPPYSLENTIYDPNSTYTDSNELDAIHSATTPFLKARDGSGGLEDTGADSAAWRWRPHWYYLPT